MWCSSRPIPKNCSIEPEYLVGFSASCPEEEGNNVESIASFGGKQLYFCASSSSKEEEKEEPLPLLKEKEEQPLFKEEKQKLSPLKMRERSATIVYVRFEGIRTKLTLKESWFERPTSDVLKKFCKWYASTKTELSDVRFQGSKMRVCDLDNESELVVERVKLEKLRAAVFLKNWNAILNIVDDGLVNASKEAQELRIRALVARRRYDDALTYCDKKFSEKTQKYLKEALLATGHLTHPLLSDDKNAKALRDATNLTNLEEALTICDEVIARKKNIPYAYQLRADLRRSLFQKAKDDAEPSFFQQAKDDADLAVALGAPLGLLVRARLLSNNGHSQDQATADYRAFLQEIASRPDHFLQERQEAEAYLLDNS